MGVYARPDSRDWWMLIEGTGLRESTGIPRAGGSPAQDKELRRQADTIYATRKTAAAKGKAGLLVTRPTITFATFAGWYAAHVVAHHRGADKETSMLGQLAGYFQRFDSLAEIDATAVKEWMTWRAHQVKRSTVNRELDLLKRVLACACPKYLERNPIAGLRRFRVEETEPRVLAPDEEDRLLQVADVEDRAWLTMAIDTLLRLSNVVHMQWPQVKTERRVIVPLNAKVSHDVVPITARLAVALASLTRRNEWVFPSFHQKGTGKTAAKNAAIRRFVLLCQKARIPYGRAAGGVTFHCLRHTGATRALQRGASVRTVMKLGGWRDETSVMRYVHAADSDVRAAAESIGGSITPHSRDRKTTLKRA